MRLVGQLGEDGLIARVCGDLATSSQVVVGPGDDCAVVGTGEDLVLLKTDAVVAGVHFLPDEKPDRVGWKAVARVLSDFAAMGGQPGELLVTLALAPEVSVDWVDGLYRGMNSCLARHGGVIVGGETTSLPSGTPAMISVAGRGMVTRKNLVTRSGGRPGDSIYVTGWLGGSIRGKHLDFTPRLCEAAWLVSNGAITAMMDLSDGLAKDLPRLAAMSGVGFKIEREALPLSKGVGIEQALGDGEDYELLFTSSEEIGERWRERFPDLALTRVGCLVQGTGEAIDGGWDHFRR
jgi:thiamine-monophosphate kinase